MGAKLLRRWESSESFGSGPRDLPHRPNCNTTPSLRGRPAALLQPTAASPSPGREKAAPKSHSSFIPSPSCLHKLLSIIGPLKLRAKQSRRGWGRSIGAESSSPVQRRWGSRRAQAAARPFFCSEAARERR